MASCGQAVVGASVMWEEIASAIVFWIIVACGVIIMGVYS